MPLYEFRCDACNRRFADLIRSESDMPAVSCPRCGGARVTRLVSLFSTTRSEEDALDRLSDGPPDDSDPRALSNWAREFSREMGDDLGDEFQGNMEEMLEQEFAGKSASEDEG